MEHFQITSRKFHYYPKGAFSATQPRDASDIPDISKNYCYCVHRNGGPPGRRSIFQRLTSCPCANCIQGVVHIFRSFLNFKFLLICVQPFLFNFQTGLFHLCLYLEHHGPYTEHIMDILYVQPDNPLEIRADHGRQIHEEILQTLALRNPPFFFGLIFEREDILRPTFILLGRQTVLHPVRVRCHVLSPDKDTNYPNYSTCCVPTNICYLHPNQCQCGGLHSQLVDYENIMLILTEFTGTGKLVSTMEVDVQNSTNISSVYSLKETYAEQIELYKRRRREMHGQYVF